VGTTEVAPDSLTTGDLATDSVGKSEIGVNSVGGDELWTTYANVSGGVVVTANGFEDESVECNGSDVALGGGFAWSIQNGETHVVYSTPDPLTAPNKWVVRGTSEANNTLYAWVVCLPA